MLSAHYTTFRSRPCLCASRHSVLADVCVCVRVRVCVCVCVCVCPVLGPFLVHFGVHFGVHFASSFKRN